MARLSWTLKKRHFGEIDYTGGDRQSRRWFVAHGTQRCRPYHADQAAQGLFTTEEPGDADRQARRHEQGQRGLTCRLAVIVHRMLAEGASFNKKRASSFRTGLDDRSFRSEVPSPEQWIALGRALRGDMTITPIREASIILFQSHRVAALRRPRTEARSRRVDNAKQ